MHAAYFSISDLFWDRRCRRTTGAGQAKSTTDATAPAFEPRIATLSQTALFRSQDRARSDQGPMLQPSISGAFYLHLTHCPHRR